MERLIKVVSSLKMQHLSLSPGSLSADQLDYVFAEVPNLGREVCLQNAGEVASPRWEVLIGKYKAARDAYADHLDKVQEAARPSCNVT